MKYMLLIHQCDTPTPRDPDAWARLSEDEQKSVYRDYQAISENPGVTSGLQLQDPETATTVRVQDGKTLTTDGPFVEIKEAIGGYLFFEADDLDAAIELGRAVLDRALALHGRGPYVMQAAIASLHADEPRDWPQIAALYGQLARLTDSPVVELSRAVAVAEEQGPEAGLDIVDRLALEDYRYLHSTRGELLRRIGRTAEARDAYRRALALVHDDAERRLLERRLAELGAGTGAAP